MRRLNSDAYLEVVENLIGVKEEELNYNLYDTRDLRIFHSFSCSLFYLLRQHASHDSIDGCCQDHPGGMEASPFSVHPRCRYCEPSSQCLYEWSW